MGKCVDDFAKLVENMKKELENGEINGEAVKFAYIGICAGHLAYIVDKLDEIASKLEEKENERSLEDNPTVDEKTLRMFGVGPGSVYNEIFGEEDKNESCPNRCIDCKHYDKHSLYTDNMGPLSPLSLGSCEKCRRNFVSIDPYNQVPSWCPLKGVKDMREVEDGNDANED